MTLRLPRGILKVGANHLNINLNVYYEVKCNLKNLIFSLSLVSDQKSSTVLQSPDPEFQQPTQQLSQHSFNPQSLYLLYNFVFSSEDNHFALAFQHDSTARFGIVVGLVSSLPAICNLLHLAVLLFAPLLFPLSTLRRGRVNLRMRATEAASPTASLRPLPYPGLLLICPTHLSTRQIHLGRLQHGGWIHCLSPFVYLYLAAGNKECPRLVEERGGCGFSDVLRHSTYQCLVI